MEYLSVYMVIKTNALWNSEKQDFADGYYCFDQKEFVDNPITMWTLSYSKVEKIVDRHEEYRGQCRIYSKRIKLED